jgi:hypothetical protein
MRSRMASLRPPAPPRIAAPLVEADGGATELEEGAFGEGASRRARLPVSRKLELVEAYARQAVQGLDQREASGVPGGRAGVLADHDAPEVADGPVEDRQIVAREDAVQHDIGAEALAVALEEIKLLLRRERGDRDVHHLYLVPGGAQGALEHVVVVGVPPSAPEGVGEPEDAQAPRHGREGAWLRPVAGDHLRELRVTFRHLVF